MPPRVDKKMYNRSGEGSVRPRIFVRPWDGVPSMLDGFAMLRGIEDKYGKIRAFTFVRVSFASGSFTLVLVWTQILTPILFFIV